MASTRNRLAIAIFGIIASLITVLFKPLALRVKVLGFTRPRSTLQNIHAQDFEVLSDVYCCEDLHYHTPSSLLFGTSGLNPQCNTRWFPPMERFADPDDLGQGKFVILDPKTNIITQLKFDGFSGPFVPHGIDIFQHPNDETLLYVFAINHLPNPAFRLLNSTLVPKARSQIELFQHRIGTKEIKYLRSIRHPLIRTPNDIYASNEHSFYVTNDHHYRQGIRRTIEDVAGQELAAWSDIVHIEISEARVPDPTAGIDVVVAIDRLHNPNGFGHGKDKKEILMGRAAAGVLVRMEEVAKSKLQVVESIQLPNTIDNPTYFQDPYASETSRDASGYVVAGLTRACEFPAEFDAVSVWWVSSGPDRQQRKLFEDDGHTVNSASTAVLVAIDPKENHGRKQAWLYVTGPVSSGIAVMSVDL